MTDNEIKKALDILDRFDLFGGQRAGRELWNEKPVDVQNEDIENFVKDVVFLKDLINRLQAENEQLNDLVVYNATCVSKLHAKVNEAKAEAYKEFAEKSAMYMVQFGLDCIKQFVKNKTKLDPILAMTITEEELNEMYQTAKEYYESAIIDPDNLLKELEGGNDART